jgi:peptidoglycan hydrolase-like protein with peptidoglycan-binding domain
VSAGEFASSQQQQQQQQQQGSHSANSTENEGMRTLTVGARGPEVGHLQRLLNMENFRNAFADPDLREDCVFGSRTEARLNQFQMANHLPSSSSVDARCWHALGHLIEVDHPVELFPQPDSGTCWSAAATMLFGDRSVGPGRALLAADHMLHADQANIQTFLTDAGLTFHAPRQWTVAELIGMMRRGPLWAAGRWNGGNASGGHVVVISAIWSDQQQTFGGTTLRIHDPWPPGTGPGSGAIYGGCYEAWIVRSLVRSGTTFNAGMLALAQR